MSSLKMTFSLASLILIFAFVAVMPVLAHDTNSGTDGIQHGNSTLTDAAHNAIPHRPAPTVTSITLAEALAGTVDGTTVVLVNNTDINTPPALVTTDANGQFLVKIAFSEALLATFGGGVKTISDDDLTITAAARSAAGNNLFEVNSTPPADKVSIADGNLAIDNPATTATESDPKVFYAVFTVGDQLFKAATETDDVSDLPIDVYIKVNADAGYGENQLVDGVNNVGTQNAASSLYKFTVIKEQLPTVTIAVPEDAGLAAKFTATLTFSEAKSALAAEDLMVTGGVAGSPTKGVAPAKTDGTVWTVDITPIVGATQVTISVKDTVATGAVIKVPPEDSANPTGLTLAADGYLVIAGSNLNTATLPNVTPTTVTGFPEDLAGFLIAGGTIDVVATGGDVIINELMIARDSEKINAGTQNDGQWIELHNKHATAMARGIQVTFNPARPAPAAPTGLQDRLSNVVNPGWIFADQFAGSPDVFNGSTNEKTPKDFVSIVRAKPGKDGWSQPGDNFAWAKADPLLTFATGRIGTPGKRNSVKTFEPVKNVTPSREVTINEVANRINGDREWIELKGPAGKSLKNWKLSIVTAIDTETEIFTFPDNDNIKISPNGYLLLTDVDPKDDLRGLAPDLKGNVPEPVRYKNAVVELKELPNDGNFLLVLRSDKTKTNHEAIQDIAGYDTGLSRANPYTELWPLTGDVTVGDKQLGPKNKLAGGKVYARVRPDLDGYAQNKDKPDETAFGVAGFTGIGYDRNAPVTAENGGTPGYANNIVKGYEQTGTGTVATPVIISEIMYATGSRANLPQWIELYNTSQTEAINLAGWRVTIMNHDKDLDGKNYRGKSLSMNYDLSGIIPPNQTFLLVAYSGNNRTQLPERRIQRLNTKRGELILSQHAFEIVLYAKAKDNKDEHRKVADIAGNLGTVTDENNPQVRGNPRSYVEPAWELPMGTNEDGQRVSIVRGWKNGVKDTSTGVVTRSTDRADLIPGNAKAAWTPYDMNQVVRMRNDTSYGHNTDMGSPGQTVGGVLPVSLSKFRPERLESGEIVIRWITESELNNAGFNILRSEKRDGQFTKINTSLIAGQGTTSERTTYSLVDKSAKPNVVYYYQIQDVSLDGQVQTLRQSRLKGDVSPAGKLTTQWAEIKALQ